MRKDRSLALFLLITVIGALLGSVLGEILSGAVPILARGVGVGLDPAATLDLFVMRLTFGFRLKLNVASAIGIIFALLFLRRS